MPRVALVHDWLVAQRGGENVLRELCRLFPSAPIYTLVHRPGSVDPAIETHSIHTSFIQRLPGAPWRFRQYLPLFPQAVAQFDLNGFDLVVSSSHCVAKGVRTHAGQRHVAYIHTPMRYLWDQMEAYLPKLPGRALWRPTLEWFLEPLRRWDVRTGQAPNVLVANSQHVAQRIRQVWGRAARVVYPPVNAEFYGAAPVVQRSGFLVAGALVPYKQTELAVRWATDCGEVLTVVGDGPEAARLRRLAGPTVRFVGPVGADALRAYYAGAQALLFCGEEDFGIVPVEATAAGCPVVALGRGGALETVVPGLNGVYFHELTPRSLGGAVAQVRTRPWDHAAMLQHAQRFDAARFNSDVQAIVRELIADDLT